MKPDALKGVKHLITEKLRAEVTLKPFDHYTPPEASNDLIVRIFNRDPTHTYIIRIVEVVEAVQLPKHRSGK